MTAITGNTYPVKDQLRAMGATWNKAQKAWMIADDRAAEARQIVASAPKSSGRARRFNSSPSSYRTVYQAGSRQRCEDAPCCGCCGGDDSRYADSYQDRW